MYKKILILILIISTATSIKGQSVLDNINTLKTLTAGGSYVYVQGLISPEDGGGGFFVKTISNKPEDGINVINVAGEPSKRWIKKVNIVSLKNIEELKETALPEYTTVKTQGYYSPLDGGQATYIIQKGIAEKINEIQIKDINNEKYKAVLSNIKEIRLKQLGCKTDSNFDNSSIVNEALKISKKIIIDDIYLLKNSIKYPEGNDSKRKVDLIGIGIENSGFRLDSVCKLGIDGSNPNTAFTGIRISGFAIWGANTVNQNYEQTALDLGYLTRNSSIDNLSIFSVDTGIKITKSWYARLSNLYIRDGQKHGIEFDCTSEQINGVQLNEVSIQGFKHNIFTIGDTPNRSVSFENCEFERSKQASVVLGHFSPVSFNSCYFEANYSESDNEATKMTWENPADIKMLKGDNSVLNIQGTYFKSLSHSNAIGNEKTSISINNTILTLKSSLFSSNDSNIYDSLIYNDFIDSKLPMITNLSIDGFPKKIYTGISKKITLKTGTFDPQNYNQYEEGFILSKQNLSIFNGEPSDPSVHKLKLRIFSLEEKTYSRPMKFRLRDAVTNEFLDQNFFLPTFFQQGGEEEFEIFNWFISDNPHYIFVSESAIGTPGKLGWELYYELYNF